MLSRASPVVWPSPLSLRLEAGVAVNDTAADATDANTSAAAGWPEDGAGDADADTDADAVAVAVAVAGTDTGTGTGAGAGAGMGVNDCFWIPS